MLFEDQTPALNSLVKRLRHQFDAKALEDTLELAKKFKPMPKNGLTFDSAVDILQSNYEGCQADRCGVVVKKRYKNTGADVHPLPLNITTEVAELVAQAYRQEPKRRLLISGEDPLELVSKGERFDRAKALQDLVTHSQMNLHTLSAERMSGILGSAFLKVRWSSIEEEHGRKPRAEFSLFSPSRVDIIPDPSAPGKPWAARVVILHLRSTSKNNVYEVWTRDAEVDSEQAEGITEIRRGWWWGRVDSEGETLIPMRAYELPTIPLVRFTHAPAGASIFPEPEWDLITVQDEVNVMYSDNAHRMALQSHLQVGIIGGKLEKGSQGAWGPGEILDLPEGASISNIPSDYDNTALDGIEQMLRMFARSKRLPIDAFWTKSGNPETGVAREIRSEFSDQKRMEHAAVLADCDEELTRLTAMVSDTWAGTSIDGEDIDYRTTFLPPKRYEDRTQRQQRMESANKLGLISDARLAVELELYEDEFAAERAGLSRALQPPTPASAPFGAPPDEDDGEKEDGDEQSDEAA